MAYMAFVSVVGLEMISLDPVCKARHKLIAQYWAYQWIYEHDPDSWVIIDTETTGLTRLDEIVQLGMISGRGQVLMDFIIKPTIDIKGEAMRVHNIGGLEVMDKPMFDDFLPKIRSYCRGRSVIMYNHEFDYRMLAQSAEAHGLELDLGFKQIQCAMKMYALYCGDWNPEYGSYKWQRLQGGDHTAIGDCFATLRIMKEMADV